MRSVTEWESESMKINVLKEPGWTGASATSALARSAPSPADRKHIDLGTSGKFVNGGTGADSGSAGQEWPEADGRSNSFGFIT